MNAHIKNIIVLFSSVVCLTACRDVSGLDEQLSPGTEALNFKIGADAGWVNSNSLTRGVSVTNSNIADAYGAEGLRIYALYFRSDATNQVGQYFYDQVIKPSASSGNVWDLENSYFWPQTLPAGGLDFFYCSLDNNIYNETTSSSAFDTKYTDEHTLQGSINVDLRGYQTPSTADFMHRSKDFVLGVTNVTTRPASDPTVSMNMKHALSAIKLNVTKTNGLKITKVTFKDIVVKSKFTFTYNKSTQALGFSFDNHSDPVYTDLYQEFTQVNISENLPGQSKQPVNTEEAEMTFFAIPQSIPDSWTDENSVPQNHRPIIVINYTNAKGEEDQVLEFSVPDISWESGKCYVYNISLLNNVSTRINITSSSSDVITDATVSNNGSKPTYVRATIVGNYHDADGNIVKAWSPSSTAGTFTGLPATTLEGADSTTKWATAGETTIVGDLTFYYLIPLQPGNSTEALFTNYTLTGPLPANATCLKLSVIVQTLEAMSGGDKSNVTEAWGLEVANKIHE